MARYAWIIDIDHLDLDLEGADATGIMGPNSITPEQETLLRAGQAGDIFRMYNDDDELCYTGRIMGEYDGSEPLDDFGMGWAGCTKIEMRGPNGWEVLIG